MSFNIFKIIQWMRSERWKKSVFSINSFGMGDCLAISFSRSRMEFSIFCARFSSRYFIGRLLRNFSVEAPRKIGRWHFLIENRPFPVIMYFLFGNQIGVEQSKKRLCRNDMSCENVSNGAVGDAGCDGNLLNFYFPRLHHSPEF